MATNVETMWVTSQDQLNATVQTLISQGGVVQGQTEGEVQIYLKKKLNVVVLVVGLILCLVPGLAYLIWYMTADQNQQITVKIGSPANIKTDHQHWYDQEAVDGAVPGSVGPAIKPTDAERNAAAAAAAAPAAPAAPQPTPMPSQVQDAIPPGYGADAIPEIPPAGAPAPVAPPAPPASNDLA